MTAPIDPDQWEDTLERLFAQLSELDCCWRDRERPMINPTDGAICLLSVLSDSGVGVDETRIEIDDSALTSDPPVECVPTQCGLRRTVLQVQIDAYDQDAKRRARFYLERIRTRLRRPSSLATLAAVATSLIDISATFVIGHTVDNRTYSRATMDVNLHTVSVERDTAFGRIDRIEGTGNLTDASGAVVKSQAFEIDLPDP